DTAQRNLVVIRLQARKESETAGRAGSDQEDAGQSQQAQVLAKSTEDWILTLTNELERLKGLQKPAPADMSEQIKQLELLRDAAQLKAKAMAQKAKDYEN